MWLPTPSACLYSCSQHSTTTSRTPHSNQHYLLYMDGDKDFPPHKYSGCHTAPHLADCYSLGAVSCRYRQVAMPICHCSMTWKQKETNRNIYDSAQSAIPRNNNNRTLHIRILHLHLQRMLQTSNHTQQSRLCSVR